MKSYATLGYRNLSRRKSRSALTVTGIVLAIGFTVGLLSISEGFMRSVDDLFENSGPEIYVMPKNVSKVPFGLQGMATIDQNFRKELESVPGVYMAEPVFMALSTEGGGTSFGYPMTSIIGAPADTFFQIRKGAKISKGVFYKSGEWRTVVLGAVVAKNLKKNIGQEIELVTGAKLQIIGVLEKADKPYDYFAYAPLEAIQEIFGAKGRASFFMVKLKDGASLEDTSRLIKEKYPKVDIQTMNELLAGFKKMMGVARVIHLCISSFALVIGVLFVACTMLMSVSERIREFATIRAIGGSKSYVVKLIVTESIFMSVIGGVAGCFFGYMLSRLIHATVQHFFGEVFFNTFVSPKIIFAGLSIAILIGVTSAIFPALVILRRNLADSLRYE